MRVYTKVKGDKVLNYFLKTPEHILINKDNFNIDDKTPIIFRGMSKSPFIKECVKNNVDFYYVDTGYFPQKRKLWHRFTKNNFQVLNHLSYEELTQRMNIKKLKDRFFEIVKKDYNSFKPELRKKGDKILITPPTNKVFKHFNYNVDKWIAETYNKIKKVTDREIVVRYKPKARSVRVNENPFLKDLNNNVHCLVTFNSITAIEAIINGCPAITLGPNAASYLTENKIDNIENPYYPDEDKIREHILYLTACQFKKEEFLDNYAIETVNALQHDQKYLDFKL